MPLGPGVTNSPDSIGCSSSENSFFIQNRLVFPNNNQMSVEVGFDNTFLDISQEKKCFSPSFDNFIYFRSNAVLEIALDF